MLRRFLDGFVRGASRLLAAGFFREVEIVGRGRIPGDRPLLFVANHVNSLVDPLLLVVGLPRLPRFLGKSTLWQNPLLKPILWLAAVIPVYRRQDEGVDASKNLETFARCHELLAAGGAIAIFPEGISHSQPSLAPLRTGAARIVLEAEQRFGPLATRIVPVGLTFDAKERFRSRALIEIGEPLDPAAEVALYGADAAGAVRALTTRIEAALKAVTLNYESWEEAVLIGRAADLFGRPGLALPEDRSLAEDFSLHAAFVEGYTELRQTDPAGVAAAAARVADYDRLLAAVRLEDEQVAARYPLPSLLRRLGRAAARLLLSFPLAAGGTVLNWAPYRLAGLISRRVSWEPDVTATYKLFPSLLLFPGFWAVESAFAGWLAGRFWALGVALAGPLLGWVALRFNDRRSRLFKDLRGYWVLATRQRLADELRQRRRHAHEAVTSLARAFEERARSAASLPP